MSSVLDVALQDNATFVEQSIIQHRSCSGINVSRKKIKFNSTRKHRVELKAKILPGSKKGLILSINERDKLYLTCFINILDLVNRNL